MTKEIYHVRKFPDNLLNKLSASFSMLLEMDGSLLQFTGIYCSRWEISDSLAII